MSDIRGVPWWDANAYARRLPYLKARMAATDAVRAAFRCMDFLEVETPALQVSPGLEPHLKAFATDLVGVDWSERRTLYLHTSPEFTMKKLLVAGLPRIFQLARVYRNGERSPTHHPEFTMLEWYRAGAGYLDLVEDCRMVVQAACRATGATALRRGGASADPFGEWELLSVAEAFARYADIDVLATAPDPVAPTRDLLAREAERIGVDAHAADSWDDIFFRVMFERIEPHLGYGRPTVLCDYPVSMAALSRPKPEDARIAERFELYACGVELANAFGELTDAAVQRARFEADMDLKERLYGERYPIDEDFLAALECGLPDCAGIALGFDRLAMLATGAPDIDSVLWAPVARP